MRQFSRIPMLVAAALLPGVLPPCVRAEHASIDLTVETDRETVEAHADDEPPIGGREKRMVQEVEAGSPLVMQFQLTNIDPHQIRKDVVVLYYVVRIETPRQKSTPAPQDATPEVPRGGAVEVPASHGRRVPRTGRNPEHEERPRAFCGDRPGRKVSCRHRVSSVDGQIEYAGRVVGCRLRSDTPMQRRAYYDPPTTTNVLARFSPVPYRGRLCNTPRM
jgi:hypothetical protein